MKIYTKIVIDMASGEVLTDEHYDYEGPLALAGGSPPSPPDTTTQIQEPWEEQKPFLTAGFERAKSDVFNRPLEFFPGSTVTPYSPESLFALNAQTSRAMQGSPLIRGAQNEIGRLLSGSYLPGMPSQSPQWATPSLRDQAQQAQQWAPAQPGGGKGGPGGMLGQVAGPTFPGIFPQPSQPAPGEPNLPPPSTNPPTPVPAPGSEPAPAPTTVSSAAPPGGYQTGVDYPAGPDGGEPVGPIPAGQEWRVSSGGYRLNEQPDDD